MTLRIKKKGSTVVLEEAELKEYIDSRLREYSGVLTNGVMALIMISLIVVFNFLQVPEMVYLSLILIPLLGRHFFLQLVMNWLRKQFREILEV